MIVLSLGLVSSSVASQLYDQSLMKNPGPGFTLVVLVATSNALEDLGPDHRDLRRTYKFSSLMSFGLSLVRPINSRRVKSHLGVRMRAPNMCKLSASWNWYELQSRWKLWQNISVSFYQCLLVIEKKRNFGGRYKFYSDASALSYILVFKECEYERMIFWSLVIAHSIIWLQHFLWQFTFTAMPGFYATFSLPSTDLILSNPSLSLTGSSMNVNLAQPFADSGMCWPLPALTHTPISLSFFHCSCLVLPRPCIRSNSGHQKWSCVAGKIWHARLFQERRHYHVWLMMTTWVEIHDLFQIRGAEESFGQYARQYGNVGECCKRQPIS